MASSIDNIWLNLKQNAEAIRLFVNDTAGRFEFGRTITEPFKARPNILLPLGDHTPTRSFKDTLKHGLVHTKDFIGNNRQDLIRIFGITVSAAMSYYAFKWLINAMDPTNNEKQVAKKKADKLLNEIGISNIELNEYELLIASNIVAPHNIDCTWEDIGGLDNLIEDLRETVIYPLKNNIYKNMRSTLMQPPKGMLLFGPPGNAKTMVSFFLSSSLS
jgi:hypothetical protein